MKFPFSVNVTPYTQNTPIKAFNGLNTLKNVEMMCQNMGMIAEKLIVLWPVMLGGRRKSAPPPAAFIPFYRLQLTGLKHR